MNLIAVLSLPILRDARVVAGHQHLSRPVKLVGALDHPQPLPFVKPHQLVLTTGYAWPREKEAQRTLVAGLARKDVAAICMAVPQYFEVLPEPVRCEAEKLGLPLLELPWEVPFAQVTLEVSSAIIAEQYEIIERAERLHRTLTRAASEASSLADLAQVLGSLLHRSVVFEDAVGHLLGFFDVRAVESEGDNSKPRMHADIRQVAIKAEYFERARKQLRALRIPSSGVSDPEMILCPIPLRKEVIGWLWIIGEEGPLGELETRAAEHAALVVGLYISHRRKVAQTQAQLGYSFVDSLLQGSGDGRARATDHVHERARLMGFEVDAPYRLCILSLETPLPLLPEGLQEREWLLGDVRSLLERQGVPPLLSPSTNRIHLVLPESASTEHFWRDLTDEPSTRWTRHKTKLAFLVGRPYKGVEGVRRSYLELSPLLPHVRFGAVQHFEQTLLWSVFQGDRQAQDTLLETVFGPLKAHPALHTTLTTLAENSFQQKAAAKALGVHLNTLRYRLERLESLSKLCLDDPEVRFRVQVAARLLLLTHKN